MHAGPLSGSFAAAGLVAAALRGLAGGSAARCSAPSSTAAARRSCCSGSAVAAAVVLVALALLPAGTPLPLLVALTLLAGLATPPVGACVRALFPELLDDADVRAAYAVDASAVELTWIAGPPLALGLGVLWSTGGALVVAALVVLLGTAAFAAQPVSRAWSPRPVARERRGGALRAPAMWTLVLALMAVGALLGAVEVAVAASTEAGGSAAAAARCSGSGAPARCSAGCSQPAPVAAHRARPA